jgi:hypothetical protein
MKGTRFADVVAIQEHVTAVLRLIPKEAFADSFQKLYERCQKCVLKANKVNFFCIFGFVCFLVPFTELFRHTTYRVSPEYFGYTLVCLMYATAMSDRL